MHPLLANQEAAVFVAPPTPDRIIFPDASVVVLAKIETDEAQRCYFFVFVGRCWHIHINLMWRGLFFIWVSKSWLPPVNIKAFLWFCRRRAPRVKQEQEEPLQLVCIKEGGNGDRLTTLRCLNRLQVLQGEGKSADCCQHLWEVYSCSLQDTLPCSWAGPHTSLNTTNQARICQTRSRKRGKICHISLHIVLMQDNLCWIDFLREHGKTVEKLNSIILRS